VLTTTLPWSLFFREGLIKSANKHVSWIFSSLLSFCRYFAEHDKASALQMLQDSLQPKHKYVNVTFAHPHLGNIQSVLVECSWLITVFTLDLISKCTTIL